MKTSHILGAALVATVLAAGPALAVDDVKVGRIYPLSGNAANAGKSAVDSPTSAERRSSA